MCQPIRCERRVSFSPDTEDVTVEPKRDDDRQHQMVPELTKRERKGLWYSKRELAESRRDVKRTIIAIYEQGGIDLLHHCDKLQEQDHDDEDTDQRQLSEHDQLCIRGCKRYYSSSGRSQVVQDFRKAVLEAQNHTRGQPNCLGQISNILSQSNKELAAWYAKLNAADCWGQQLLVGEEQQLKEQPPLEQLPSPSPSSCVKITTVTTLSLPATGTGYRMATDGAIKENRLWRRSR